ncbi:MAG: YlxR family protein [Pelotomaculum sp.]|uniref:Predicted nucleic acid-binding protein n=1 Tax=Pelotomaculum thermopropionicum (strain DSM 13744 / JCM 10971 / SI) TaxID=370438 RepID=A5D2V0_PELTS|nr:YlxR family protein [Pelotomaculum sp.]BAF59448.1 predicted nucleic acid-binding protein [Pelotomaculum thermopropionicum SI]
MPRVKKIPQRMCVGCQEMKPKRQLIRIVRTPEEKIEIDPTGKRSGRGAYICPEMECFNKAIKGKRLEKALQRPIAQEVLEALRQGLVK